nr:interleukin-1 family member 10 isoform X3 [Camelus dromedarius]
MQTTVVQVRACGSGPSSLLPPVTARGAAGSFRGLLVVREKICILPNRGLDRTNFPIFLGIQGGSRCLACVETGDGPSLQLEDVNIEDLYKNGEQATRFTFFQRSLGPAFRLEAAAWPGWFLCGSAEPQQPIRLTKESEPSACTEFYFEQSR